MARRSHGLTSARPDFANLLASSQKLGRTSIDPDELFDGTGADAAAEHHSAQDARHQRIPIMRGREIAAGGSLPADKAVGRTTVPLVGLLLDVLRFVASLR